MEVMLTVRPLSYHSPPFLLFKEPVQRKKATCQRSPPSVMGGGRLEAKVATLCGWGMLVGHGRLMSMHMNMGI